MVILQVQPKNMNKLDTKDVKIVMLASCASDPCSTYSNHNLNPRVDILWEGGARPENVYPC